MMELGLPLIPVVDNATSHLLASAFVGIIMCRAVYILTGYVSVLCFKGYDKLSYKQKMEWNNRGFSTFHALFAASLSLYLLLYSDLFKEDPQDGLIINNYSFLSNSVLGISIGYFLTDLAMILWFYPVLGGLEYVARILLFIYFFVHMYIHFDEVSMSPSSPVILGQIPGLVSSSGVVWLFFQVKTIFPLGLCTLLTVPPMLTMMNVFWFWKIAKGMVKTLSKSRQSQVHNHIQ
ncbi:unnamed protein product [Linum tenue]|uniref:TLC domain-containing protein n=1 Tax=Linum tenue TaxID=586396 RepID=A0AAV0LDH5_9ROSI|nr:unnamed protein product [Linum tenue]